jgi:hypothetical protein
MNSLAPVPASKSPPRPPPDLAPDRPPDYCSRALSLWPRLERSRLARVRHDPNRVATLISRRTNLSHSAILDLLGAPPADDDTLTRDN